MQGLSRPLRRRLGGLLGALRIPRFTRSLCESTLATYLHPPRLCVLSVQEPLSNTTMH